jgi:hypothetical protein
MTGLVPPVAFYHLWAGDDHHGANWLTPAREFFGALRDSQFDGDVRVGLAGGYDQQEEAMSWLDERWPSWMLLVQASEGFEMATLDMLHKFAKDDSTDPATPVLYAHGKGSFMISRSADEWRRNMIRHLVGGPGDRAWERCVTSLHSVDAVGCHWLTREEYPGKIFQPGIFGGNFFWANAGYLASLAPVGWSSRYCAEGWVGLGSPRVECLADGWPQY